MYLVIEQYNETMDISAIKKFKRKTDAVEYLKNAGYVDFEDEGGVVRGVMDYSTCFIIPLKQIKAIG